MPDEDTCDRDNKQRQPDISIFTVITKKHTKQRSILIEQKQVLILKLK